MDYDAYIKKLGSFGKFQKRLLFVIFAPAIFNSFSAPVSIFFFGDQKYRCKILEFDNDTYAVQSERHMEVINWSIPIKSDGNYDGCNMIRNGTLTPCSDWVYDQTVFVRTVNTQFDMVCDKELFRSHATMAFFFGALMSTLVLTPLGDVFGRKNLLCVAVTLQFVANIVMPFSANVQMFGALRFFDGFFGSCYYHEAFILGMEFVGPMERILAGTVMLLVYCFGEFLLVGIAFFMRDWKWLQLILAIPMASQLLYWWPGLLTESPRWLISRGRYEEALSILRYAAKMNGVEWSEDLSEVKVQTEDQGVLKILRELVQSRKLMIRWVIILANWFVISYIYYGLTINIGKLGGNLYINFTVSVIMETLGYSLCFMLNKFGRKPLHLVVMFGSGIACLLSILPVLLEDSSLNWIMVSFAMIGKLGISAGFGEIYIYTGELFPTVVRSLIMGVSSAGARVGSAVSPYTYHLADGRLGNALPLLIYGVLTIVVAILSITLPETKQRKLLEHVDDAEHEEDLIINSYGGNKVPETGQDEDDEEEC